MAVKTLSNSSYSRQGGREAGLVGLKGSACGVSVFQINKLKSKGPFTAATCGAYVRRNATHTSGMAIFHRMAEIRFFLPFGAIGFF